jgi:hypothetical protein
LRKVTLGEGLWLARATPTAASSLTGKGGAVVPHSDDPDTDSNGDVASVQAKRVGEAPLLPRLLRLTVLLGTALLCWAPPLLIVYWLVS